MNIEQIRNEALEEAAKLCERLAEITMHQQKAEMALALAEYIRMRKIDSGEQAGQAPAAGVGLTDEQIVAVWNSMPGGPDGWLKNFGFIQFARALLAAQAGGVNHG